MENFNFYSPTYFAFGKGKECEVGALVKRFGGSKVLLHYGGGSVKHNGVFDSVTKSLNEAQIPYIELGGVKPNPRSGLVYEGIELCRKEKIEFRSIAVVHVQMLLLLVSVLQYYLLRRIELMKILTSS